MNTPNEKELDPRSFGKTTRAFMRFFVEGVAGKAVMYATAQGKFLSPKAVENALAESRRLARKKMLERCIGLIVKEKNPYPDQSIIAAGFGAGMAVAHDRLMKEYARLQTLEDANSSEENV